MNYIESLLMWAHSLQAWLGDRGIVLRYGVSPSDRLTQSCWVNIQRGDREAELLLWESGEAEFNFGGPKVEVTQEHHEFRQVSDLGVVLGRLLGAIGDGSPSGS